jgi:hypothetical protein
VTLTAVYFLGAFHMAVKRKTRNEGYAEFRSVVQLALMPDQVEEVRATEGDCDAILTSMIQMVSDGYRVQLAPNSRGEGYQASSMQTNPEADDAGLMLVAKAPSPEGALAGLIYKHFFVLKALGYSDLPTSQAGSYA